MKNMEKKRRIPVGLLVIVGVLIAGIVGVLVVKVCFDRRPEEVPEEMVTNETTDDEYGYIDPELVSTVVAKFNQKVLDQIGLELTLANGEDMIAYDDKYWYPLEDGVALVIVPADFSGVVESDQALATLIYVDGASTDQERVLKYFKCLVWANKDSLSVEEIDELIAGAEGLRERGEMVNHGDGIFVAISGAEDHTEYQVVRNYREE